MRRICRTASAGMVFAQETATGSRGAIEPIPFSLSIGGGFGVGINIIDAMLYNNYDIFAFFDATYAELSLGYSFNEYFSLFKISLLGKYPFAINNKLRLFPLLGISFELNTTFFRFGVGMDFLIANKIFLRPEVLYDQYFSEYFSCRITVNLAVGYTF